MRFRQLKSNSIKISQKFVPQFLINNIPALVHIMAWHRPGGKPLLEPIMARLLTHIFVTRPQRVKSIHCNSFDYWTPVQTPVSPVTIKLTTSCHDTKCIDRHLWHRNSHNDNTRCSLWRQNWYHDISLGFQCHLNPPTFWTCMKPCGLQWSRSSDRLSKQTLRRCPITSPAESKEYMMASSNGYIFLVTDPLWGESTCHRWIPLTKASNAELWYVLWSAPEQTAGQAIGMLVIWDAMALIITSLYIHIVYPMEYARYIVVLCFVVTHNKAGIFGVYCTCAPCSLLYDEVLPDFSGMDK